MTDVEKGLTNEIAAKKYKIHGPNVLTERKKTPWFVDFAKEQSGYFALMLWAGAGFSLVAYGLETTDPSTVYLNCSSFPDSFMPCQALPIYCAHGGQFAHWYKFFLTEPEERECYGEL